MTTRPAIPKEIQRRVLVEAGHRCAIHTCKSSPTEIHHITPWEKCKEHSFDNLISLCPNCHTRAHSGDIDRKSLMMYKARLSALSETPIDRVDNDALRTATTLIKSTKWKRESINEDGASNRKYSVQIEYPIFDPDDGELGQINTILKAEAISALIAQRSESLYFDIPEDPWWAETGDAYASTFEVVVFTGEFVSLRHSLYTYFAGAAHPNHGTSGVNFVLNPLMELKLDNLFKNPQDSLNAISEYCIKFLELENHDTEPNDWVRKGAGPNWRNYRNFVLENSGLTIIFNPYEVGCYAEGQREVFLSDRFLGPMLRDGTKLKKLWWWQDA